MSSSSAGDSQASTEPPVRMRVRPGRVVLDALAKVVPGARPWLQRNLIRGGYSVLSVMLNREELSCMNYGYAPEDTPQSPGVPEQAERYSLQLYEKVAGSGDIAGKDVLEVGSGRGGGAAFCAERFGAKSMTGVDLSDRAVQFSRDTHTDPRLSFVQGDAENLPFADGTFDVVLNVESSHCYPSVPNFAREVARVLKPGGRLLIADLRLRDVLPAWEAELLEGGFEIVAKEEITDGVLRGLTLDADRRRALVERRVPKFLHTPMSNFAGASGTDLYDGMRDHKLGYVRYELKKPERAGA